MAPIEVQLIPEQRYTVKCGELRIAGMRVTGVWEGMTRLQDANGKVLVLEPLDGPLSQAFKDLFARAGLAGPDEDYQRAVVVKGSPSLLVALAEPQNVLVSRQGGADHD